MPYNRAMRNTVGLKVMGSIVLVLAILFSLLPAPSPAHANEKVIVFFFSGLCPPGRPDACAAKQQAEKNISPKLPSGAEMHAPDLYEGSFRDAAQLNEALSKIGGNKIVFIAFSAGNKALWQMVSKMNQQQLMQVKTMVSLEAQYAGWTNSVQTVRRVNPKVEVREFSASQFGTNHDKMPGTEGIGQAIAAITGAAQTGTVAQLPPDIFKNNQQVQVQYQPNPQQQVQQQLATLYNRPFASSGPLPYLPMPTMTSGLQQAYQPVTTPQQIASYVQSSAEPSTLLTSATGLSPVSSQIPTSTVTFTSVSIGQDSVSSIENTNTSNVATPKDIVSVVVNSQNITPISANTFTSADLAGNRIGSVQGFESNNAVITTLQNIMRGVVSLLQSIVNRQ